MTSIETVVSPSSATQFGQFDVVEALTDEECALFRELLLGSLPSYYGDVDATFPDSIIASARDGVDINGHFTKAKRLFVLRLNGRPVGFSVATYKRGGSVKMGPTVLVPAERGKGLARKFRLVVEARILGDPQIRKLYLTVNARNTRAVSLNLSLGFRIEGVLQGQYKSGSSEIVMGKFAGSPAPPDTPIEPARDPDEVCKITRVQTLSPEFGEFVLTRLAMEHDDLDESFVAACMDATAADRQSFDKKGKTVLRAAQRNRTIGFAILTHKRGGALKVSPLVADSNSVLDGILSETAQIAGEIGCRRLYTFVDPSRTAHLAALMRNRFYVEAQLREPYRPNVDMLVLGHQLG